MPEAAKAKNTGKPSAPRRTAASKGGADKGLESLVEKLVGEIASLRAEVAQIREAAVDASALDDRSIEAPLCEITDGPIEETTAAVENAPCEQVEEAADAVLADMVEQIGGQSDEDENAFLAEMEFAIANPDLTPVAEDEAAEDEGEADEDPALQDLGGFESGELDDLIKAFEQHEEQSASIAAPDNEARREDGFESLLQEDSAAVPHVPEGTIEAPLSAQSPADAVPSDDDTALSEDEIAALFAATADLGAPLAEAPAITGPQTLSPHEHVETSGEVLSAAEIQAMLGITEVGGPDLSEEVVEPTLADGHDESESLDLTSLEGTDDAPLVGSDALSEAGPEPDLDNVDPEAVRQVPADLAVAALALPACVANGRLYCLCAEPFDQAGLDALSKATGMEVVARPAPVGRVVQELRARYGGLDTETARAAITLEAETPHLSLFAKLLRRRSA